MNFRGILHFCLCFLLFSCNNRKDTNPEEIDYMIIKGTVKNAKVKDVLIGFGSKRIKKLVNNSFIDTIRRKDINSDDLGVIFFDRKAMIAETIYFREGLVLEFNVDMNDFNESMLVQGSGAKYLEFLKEYEHISKIELSFDSSEYDFIEKLDRKVESIVKFLKDNNNLDVNLIQIKNDDLEVNRIVNLISYLTENPDSPNTLIWKAIKSFNLDNIQRYKKNNYYAYYVDQYLKLLMEKEGNLNPELEKNLLFESVLKKLNYSRDMQSALAYKYFSRFFEYTIEFEETSPEILEKNKNSYLKYIFSKEDKDNLEANYQRIIKLAKGKPAPNFILKNLEGQEVSLNEFIGKNVLIDVWGTYCGPCLADFDLLENLLGEEKDRNLVLLKVGHDTKDNILNYLEDKKESDIHLLANKSFLRNYMIGTIPRYIFIDKAGKIITVNAKGPRFEDTKQLLKDLL